MNFMRRFGDEEQTAADQDDVPPGNGHAKEGYNGRGEAHQPGEAGEHDHAENEREREADLSGAACLLGIEAGGQDGDEDEIVDAEHDLEHAST